MEITIEDEEDNPLLNRREIRFSIVHDGETPSRLAVRDSIAAKIDKASDEVIVHEMNTRFGMNETLGFAKVYETPEDAREIEEEYMLARNKVATNGDEPADADEDTGEPEAAEPEDGEGDEAEQEAEEADDDEPEEAEESEDDEAAEDDGEEGGAEGDEADAEDDGDDAAEADEGDEEAEA